MHLFFLLLVLVLAVNYRVADAKLSKVVRSKSTEKYNEYKVVAAAATTTKAR